MLVKDGILRAEIGDRILISDPHSTMYGAVVPVVYVNEYPTIGEWWYLGQFPEGSFPENIVPGVDGSDHPTQDTMWFKSLQVTVVTN